MTILTSRTFLIGFFSLVLSLLLGQFITLNSPFFVSQAQENSTFQGIQLPLVDPQFRNQWTPQLEAEFQQKAKTVVQYYAKLDNYGNLHQENEKGSYPKAMFDFLAGHREQALQFLQADDPQQAEHAHTNGIDYYFCFTLKGQVRKYFLLKDFLEPNYRQKMYEGAKKWTEKDPLMRPHPLYGFGDESGRDWSIRRRGRWVDGRNTDNLRAMRETSVYLMAEETGNEETRQIYKNKIRRYVGALYNIGMGEWDSPVYHAHTFAPYLNLYDFAQDPDVKSLAKAALDWLSTAAAIKYNQGGWGGPSKRDYGGSHRVFSADASRAFWLYFGDTVIPNPKPERDTLYFMTSTYRPPLAVVALAKKQFPKPVELFATKPLYENWKSGKDQLPGYWETQFFGQTYQMGSVAGAFADKDVKPFALMAENPVRGVDYFGVNTVGDWIRPGKNSGDEIGQYENLLLWLRPTDQSNFYFQIPQTATLEKIQNIWFIQLEKTWLAIFPINLSNYQNKEPTNSKLAQAYQEERVFASQSQGNFYSGFALEVGEKASHGTYQNFKKIIQQKATLNLSAIEQGSVIFKSSQDKMLEFRYNPQNLLPILTRDGTLRNWHNQLAIYDSQTPDKSPVYLGWKEGKLTVKVNHLHFTNEVIGITE